MQLRILGCSGGISPGNGTTAFLVDSDLLIDAGTGVESLTHDEMCQVNNVLITHSHLDHICHLPFLLNNLIGEADQTVEVFGLPETIEAIQKHIFNNIIWPDFTVLPNVEKPSVRLNIFNVGDELSIADKKITILPAVHSVPSVGFYVSDGHSSFAFSGDCAANDAIWQALNHLAPADLLIVDDQYLESEKEISELAKHYYPAQLKADLEKLNYQPHLYLSHLPPYKKQEVLAEAQAVLHEWQPQAIYPGQVIDFPF